MKLLTKKKLSICLLLVTFQWLLSSCTLHASISDLSSSHLDNENNLTSDNPKITLESTKNIYIEGQNDFHFKISINPISNKDITVNLSYAGNLVSPRRKGLPTSVTIPAGVQFTSIDVEVIDDNIWQNEENLEIIIESFTAGILEKSNSLTLKLRDNEIIVNPFYPQASNWNDYLDYTSKNRRDPRFSNGVLSSANNASPEKSFHAGEVKKVEFNTHTSCNNLRAQDLLNVFNWLCDDSQGTVFFYSQLKEKKGLSDLIDFNTLEFLDNSVSIIEVSSSTQLGTTSQSKWWSNTITNLPTSTSGVVTNVTGDGTIFVITQNIDSAGRYSFNSDKMSLVTKPGTSLNIASITLATAPTCASSTICFLKITGKFFWFEGNITRNPASGGSGAGIFSLGNSLRVNNSTFTNWRNSVKSSDNVNLTIKDAKFYSDYGQFLTLGSGFVLAQNIDVFSASHALKITDFTFTKGILSNVNIYNAQGPISLFSSGGLTFHKLRIHSSMSPISVKSYYSSIFIESNLSGGDIALDEILSTNIILASNFINNATAISTSLSHEKLLLVNSNVFNNTTGVQLIHTGSSNNLATFRNNFFWKNDTAINFPNPANNIKFEGSLLMADNVTSCNIGSVQNNVGINSACLFNGSSTATLSSLSGIDTPIIGATNDSVNLTPGFNSTGQSIYNSIIDISNFENFWRVINKTANAFDLSSRDSCSTGICQVYDLRLKPTSALGLNLAPTPLTGTACPDIVHGNNFDIYYDLFLMEISKYLKNSIELMFDGFGNDNGLCESDEACLYLKNTGPYQGSGEMQECIFQEGILKNIKVYFYPNP